jgi:hypothetical protein
LCGTWSPKSSIVVDNHLRCFNLTSCPSGAGLNQKYSVPMVWWTPIYCSQ